MKSCLAAVLVALGIVCLGLVVATYVMGYGDQMLQGLSPVLGVNPLSPEIRGILQVLFSTIGIGVVMARRNPGSGPSAVMSAPDWIVMSARDRIALQTLVLHEQMWRRNYAGARGRWEALLVQAKAEGFDLCRENLKDALTDLADLQDEGRRNGWL